MSQLGQLSQVVGDSTDPAGTLRPNLPPEPETGNNYNLLPHPDFDFEIRGCKTEIAISSNSRIRVYCTNEIAIFAQMAN
jgi:hypothetical protein